MTEPGFSGARPNRKPGGLFRPDQAVRSGFRFLLLAVQLWGGNLTNPAARQEFTAFATNPALLADRHRPRFTVQFLSLDAGMANNAFTFAQYNRYSGAYLTESDKQELLNSIPGNGCRLNTQLNATPLVFSAFNTGLTVTTLAGTELLLPRDLFDLALEGNQLGRQYSVTNLDVSGLAYSDINIAFGLPVNSRLALGLGISYLRGLGIIQTLSSSGYLITTPSAINSEAVARYRWATGGNGWGLSLGASCELATSTGLLSRCPLHIGIALRNLSPGISWRTGIQTGSLRIALDSFSIARIHHPDLVTFESAQQPDAPFRSPVPGWFLLGTGWQPLPRLNLELYLLTATCNTPLSSTRPEAHIAAEYWLFPWGAIDLGTAVGGKTRSTARAGITFRLGSFQLRGEVLNQGGILANARGGRLSLGAGYHLCAAPAPAAEQILYLHTPK